MFSYRGHAVGRFGSASPRTLAAFLIAIGLLDVTAGALVLFQRRSGRILAMVLAGLGLIGALVQLGRGPSSGLVSIAINAFILYALAINPSAFQRRTPGSPTSGPIHSDVGRRGAVR